MVFGGAMNVDEEGEHPWLADQKALLRDLLDARVPLLGVCLGAQLLAEAAGEEPRRAPRPEIGWEPVELTVAGREDPLLGVLPTAFNAFQWHSYEMGIDDGEVLARSEVCAQAARFGPLAWAIQFHAEVSERDALKWIADYESDPDAVAIGLDPEALAAETRERIGAWNQLGRDLCRALATETRERCPGTGSGARSAPASSSSPPSVRPAIGELSTPWCAQLTNRAISALTRG